MLGVGWTEMLVIGVVALIVIGPKELPALMQRLGKFAGTVRRMGQDFQRELNKTTGLNEVKNLRTAITQPLKSTTDAIRKEFNTTTASGAVAPSGALKPGDPKAESVVDEIHKAAGMAKPAEPVKGTVGAATEPVKAFEPAKAAAATTAAAAAAPSKFTPEIITPSSASPPVPETRPKPKRARKSAPKKAAASSEAPAKPAATKKPRTAKAVDSPAPAEALAPEKPARKRKPAAKKST